VVCGLAALPALVRSDRQRAVPSPAPAEHAAEWDHAPSAEPDHAIGRARGPRRRRAWPARGDEADFWIIYKSW